MKVQHLFSARGSYDIRTLTVSTRASLTLSGHTLSDFICYSLSNFICCSSYAHKSFSFPLGFALFPFSLFLFLFSLLVPSFVDVGYHSRETSSADDSFYLLQLFQILQVQQHHFD